MSVDLYRLYLATSNHTTPKRLTHEGGGGVTPKLITELVVMTLTRVSLYYVYCLFLLTFVDSEMSLIRTAPSQRRGQSQSPSRRGSIQQTPTRGTSSIPVSHGVQNTTPTAGTRPPTFASATLHGEGSIYAGVSLPSQSTMESRSQTHTTSQGVPSSFNLDLTPSSGLSADRNVISLTPATSIDHSTDFYTERGSLLRKIADLQALNRSLEDSRSALQTENSECMRRYSNEVNVSTLLQNVIRDRDAQIEQLTAQLQRANDRLAFLDHQQQDPNLFGN